MASYRISRNTEACVVDYIKAQLLADGWTGIRIEKSFAEVYKGELPCICINSPDRPIKRREIGSNEIFKDITIEIRIFATSDGQRLDLADWVIEKVIPGIIYYQYVITNGVVTTKTAKGRININEVTDNRKELKNTENLDKEDRYRHLISLNCRIALS